MVLALVRQCRLQLKDSIHNKAAATRAHITIHHESVTLLLFKSRVTMVVCLQWLQCAITPVIANTDKTLKFAKVIANFYHLLNPKIVLKLAF